MADEKVKRGVSFLLLGFGGESGIKWSTLEVQMI
jgi:hypothetical protein